ncbi:ABC transporter permease [Treponema sp. OMZ 840]|uniref:ABC transporter permease n=1 Tax=Treponema sp. OMZ 840 TaxID=244313 RepID=UPI003D8BD37F
MKLKGGACILSAAAAPFAGLLTALAIILCTSTQPLEAALSFFTLPLTNLYYAGTWLNGASLLIIAGLGAALAMQSGNMNLGGEGQVYIGGFCAVLIMNALLPEHVIGSSAENTAPAQALMVFAVSCAALAGSAAAGGAASFIPALLKRRRGISELISSFLLSAALIPLIDYAVSGPLRDQSKNLLAMPFIHKLLRFKQILAPSPLNISAAAAIPLALLCAYFLYKTRRGQRFRICGKAPEFALYCAYPLGTVSTAGMIVSGMFHGIAGYAAVAGTYYTCHSGFYAGMGWNALSAALIARSNPIALIPVSLFLSYIFTGTSAAAVAAHTSYDAAFLVQGAVMLFISAQFVYKSAQRIYKPARFVHKRQERLHTVKEGEKS